MGETAGVQYYSAREVAKCYGQTWQKFRERFDMLGLPDNPNRPNDWLVDEGNMEIIRSKYSTTLNRRSPDKFKDGVKKVKGLQPIELNLTNNTTSNSSAVVNFIVNKLPAKVEKVKEITKQKDKPHWLKRRWFMLLAAFGCIVVQASHFSRYYLSLVADENPQTWLIIYATVVGVLVEMAGLVFTVNGKSKWWLILFCIAASLINWLMLEGWIGSPDRIIGKILMASIIPVCIFGFSDLYNNK